jgi:hypothetical protein
MERMPSVFSSKSGNLIVFNNGAIRFIGIKFWEMRDRQEAIRSHVERGGKYRVWMAVNEICFCNGRTLLVNEGTSVLFLQRYFTKTVLRSATSLTAVGYWSVFAQAKLKTRKWYYLATKFIFYCRLSDISLSWPSPCCYQRNDLIGQLCSISLSLTSAF